MLLISVGCLILGIGLVCLALVNIRGQTVRSVPFVLPSDAYSSPPSSPTTAAASQVGSKGHGLIPKKTSRDPAPTPGSRKLVYAKNPSEGDTLGSLSIPVLGTTLPIIEGTGNNDLKKGVGHYTQSVFPGAKDNCVLSGHRDTVLEGIGKLKIGDQLIVQTRTGTFTYRIGRIRIVHADDKTVIVPADHAVLTLTTCYPFHFIGPAPDRYVLSADMVKRK